jgi:hypothetical protein
LSGLLGILIAPFRIQRFLFGFMFADQRIRFRVIGTQLVPGYGPIAITFFNGNDAGFTWIGRSGWHSSSFFYV